MFFGCSVLLTPSRCILLGTPGPGVHGTIRAHSTCAMMGERGETLLYMFHVPCTLLLALVVLSLFALTLCVPSRCMT